MSKYHWWVDERTGKVHRDYETPISHEEKLAKMRAKKKRDAQKKARKRNRRK
jgi:hypothetical protein